VVDLADSSHTPRTPSGIEMRINTHENWGRVTHHNSGGYTEIEIINPRHLRLHMPRFDVVTEIIPRELRRIGSRVYFRRDVIWPEESDTAEVLRVRVRQAFRVLQGPNT